MTYTKTDLTVISKGWSNETLGRAAQLSDGTVILKGRESSGIALRPDGTTCLLTMINNTIYIKN